MTHKPARPSGTLHGHDLGDQPTEVEHPGGLGVAGSSHAIALASATTAAANTLASRRDHAR